MNPPRSCLERGLARHLRPALLPALAAVLLATPAAAAAGAPAATRTGVAAAFPLAFEENRGQLPAGVRYAARSGALHALFEDDGLRLQSESGETRLVLVGTRPGLRPEAEAPLPGVVHYHQGNDASRWALGVRRHARIRYGAVWPGIDMLVHSRGGQIEYDFELAPGADPGLISMRVERGDAEAPEIAADGRLLLGTGARALQLHAPEIYQETAAGRIPIAGHYRSLGERVIGFEVEAHDPTLALVIDPVVLARSTRLGGSGADQLGDIALDASGALYLVGQTTSADFLGAGSAASGNDAFVAKLSPDGQSLVYVTILGGSGYDAAVGVRIDASGNAHVSGHTESPDFPTANAFQAALAGGADAFMTRLDAAGVVQYSTYYGGSDFDGRFIGGIALSPSGIAYIAGRTMSPTDLPTVNPFHSVCAVTLCSFAAGFDTMQSGSASLVYGSYISGNSDGGGIRVGVDAAGQVYVFGFTSAKTGLVDPAQGFQIATGDLLNRDHFLIVLDPSQVGAAQRVYSTYIGAPGDEVESGDLAVRADGMVLVTGQTSSTAALPDPFPTKNAIQPDNAGSDDAYVLMIDTTKAGAASLVWGTFLGTAGSDSGDGVAFDAGGGALIGMHVGQSGFPMVSPLPMFGAPPDDRGVVLQLSADGQTKSLATPVTAAGRVRLDASGRIHVAGATTRPDFPLEASLPPSPLGGADLFIARLDPADAGLSLELGESADPVGPGEPFAYRETLRNGGPDTEGGLLTLASDDAPNAPVSQRPAPCFGAAGGLQCEFQEEPLAPGENLTIWLAGSSPSEGTFAVSAAASSPNADPIAGDNAGSEDVTVATGASGVPAGVLRIADFDANGPRSNIGAFTMDTAGGVLATANGVLDDGWNFMVYDGSLPLHVVEIFSQGLLAFGFVERVYWTPGPFDPGDLIGDQYDAPVDRVFVVVDQWGHVELRSADAFNPGVLIAKGAVDLHPDRAFELQLDVVGSTATVLYGGNVVVSGNPFPADPDAAAAAEVGNDMVVSLGYGNSFLGGAIITNAPLPISDADGVADASDNCPHLANGPAEAGVPGVGNQQDSDGDGIGDACACGDVDLDGFFDAADVAEYRDQLADPVATPFSQLATDKCNVTSPIRACDLLDVVIMRRALALQPPGLIQACRNANP